MEKDSNTDERILTLLKQNKKIFRTVLPGTDTIESVYNLLLEQNKISSTDILVDQEGVELDLKRFKIKHLVDGILCLKSDFSEPEENLHAKISMVQIPNIQASAEKKDDYKFYTKALNPIDIAWSDLRSDDQLTLIRNLCKFGFEEKTKGEFWFSEELWEIKSFALEALDLSFDKKQGVWIPKVVVNLELCKKSMSNALRQFLHRKNSTLDNIDSKQFYEKFGTIAPTKLVLGAVNMSLISDEDKWKDEYNRSNFCEIFSCGISNQDDDSSEYYYNWAVTKVLEHKDSLTLTRKLFKNESGSLSIPSKSDLDNKDKKVPAGLSKLEGYRRDYGSEPFETFFVGDRANGRGAISVAGGGIYEGEFKDGKYHGKGAYLGKNGNFYEGEYVRGRMEGKGLYYFASGNQYEGDFKADMFHGNGVHYWTSGNRYEGEYRSDKKNGKGTYHFASGNKYIGDFKDDLSHGWGIFYWTSGNRYEGEYRTDKKNGRGVYYFASGNKYEGEFKDNLSHGKGVFTWSNGNRYVGEYKFDKKNGYGIYYFASGNRYEGEFKDDLSHGKGAYYWTSGNKFEGDYKDDKKCGRGIFYFANGNRFEGEFKDGKQNGKGTFYWKNGDKYIGEYRDDKKHGNGVFYTSTGEVYDEIWDNDELESKVLRK